MGAIVDAAGPHVAPLLARIEERLSAAATAHGEVLGAHAGETIAAGGKRLRPLLVVLAAGPAAQDEERVVRAAVAVELVHSATLVHDDVLDEASLRRGRPTVVARAGAAMATAAGDLLFSRAFAELAAPGGRPEALRALSAASSALARGELLQRADAWSPTVTVARYLERCELKTARLFQAACELGALEAGRNAPARSPERGETGNGSGVVEALGAFGRRIGLAFQLLDDVLDVSGPAERTGKHRGADLLDGTITLPLILARERDRELAELDPRSVRTSEQAATVCDAVVATGALQEARAWALDMVGKARTRLPVLPDAQRRALDLVAESVVQRYA
ncbi:MAG TPA: polyprenyl synthetase family protein [Solirubrobacteraceae bacterium]|nr:polyprenyl synthetase family protein [Solirubrobacteraceae bacterium]